MLGHVQFADGQFADGQFLDLQRFETRLADRQPPDREAADRDRADRHRTDRHRPSANANRLLAGAVFRRLVMSRAMMPPFPSNQLQPLEAGVTLLADDDVIVHRNAERARHGDDLLRHLDIGARRCRIAGGMIVHEDDGGRR